MHKLSRHLIRIGILLTIASVVLALLFGLSIGLTWWFAVAGVFHLMAFITSIGSLITIIGGIAAVVVGLTLKAVAWGLRHHRHQKTLESRMR